MSLHQLANHMSARGRGPDSTLVHMSPREVEGLQKLAVANGTTLTINPDTGLPEAFSLQDLLPTLIGGAATYLTGGAITPLMAALGTGAVTALTSKDLGKGLMAGLGAYGGAGIVSGLAGFGAADIGEKAVSSAAADAAAEGLSNTAGSQADAYAAAMQKGVGDRMAGASYSDRFGAGLSKAMSDPMGAASAIGGGSKIAGLTKVAGALSPLLAGETGNTVQTVTKRPSTAVIRPYRYDNMSQTFEEGTPYAAAKGGLMGLANGGAVRRFDNGGFAATALFDPNANFMTQTAPNSEQNAFANQFAKDNENNASLVAAQGLYGDVLDRKAESPEVLQNWATKFGSTIDDSERDIFRAAAASETSTRANQSNYIPISGLNALYQSELGRPGEKAGMDFWQKTFGDYIDPTELAGFKAEAAKERAARPVVKDSVIGGGGTDTTVQNTDVVTDLTTADKKYIASGVGGSTGAGQEGGGTTVNPNGTITTSPRIPGIPVGGFTGMTQVRDAYTKGGGDLGYTSYAPKTIDEFNKKYTNTGYQKEMYDYLMGKGDRPTKMKNADGTFREVSRPYNEAVLGVPGSTNVKRFWDKTKGEYFRNPDYVRQEKIYDPTTKKTNVRNYMSVNSAKAALTDKPYDIKELMSWAERSFVDDETLSEATGLKPFELQKLRYDADEAGATPEKKVWVKSKPAAKGGLMSLANGGAVRRFNGMSGSAVEGEYIDSTTGDKYILDNRYGGGYRKEKVIKDGLNYTWDRVSNSYKLAGAGAGIAGLMDMSGGSNAGDARGPGTGNEGGIPGLNIDPLALGMARVANIFTSDQSGKTAPVKDATFNPTQAGIDYAGVSGKSSFGKSGNADQDIGGITNAYADPSDVMGALSDRQAIDRQAIDRQAAIDARENVREGIATLGSGQVAIADAREARDLANARADRDASFQSSRDAITSASSPTASAANAAAALAAGQPAPFNSKTASGLATLGVAPAPVPAPDLTNPFDITDIANRYDTAAVKAQNAIAAMIADLAPATAASNARANAIADAREARDLANAQADADAANLADFNDRTDGGNYSGVIGGGVDAGGVPDGRYSGSYDFAHGGMAGYAQGGLGSLGGYSDGGRLLRGPGDGVSDSIPASIGDRQPARLADGEFVVPARIVSELGNGSTEAGARALYKMMARIQANRRKTTGKNSVAVDSKAHKYLPA